MVPKSEEQASSCLSSMDFDMQDHTGCGCPNMLYRVDHATRATAKDSSTCAMCISRAMCGKGRLTTQHWCMSQACMMLDCTEQMHLSSTALIYHICT